MKNMQVNRWKMLLLFGFGLALGAAFCMKWLEQDFWAGGEKFTMLGLECWYSQDRISHILSTVTGPARMALQYQLYFDFLFMAGVYPAITALCMLARERVKGKRAGQFLFLLAAAQLAAWTCDITENSYLLGWMKNPAAIGSLSQYHLVVFAKWSLALFGVLAGGGVLLFRMRPKLS